MQTTIWRMQVKLNTRRVLDKPLQVLDFIRVWV